MTFCKLNNTRCDKLIAICLRKTTTNGLPVQLCSREEWSASNYHDLFLKSSPASFSILLSFSVYLQIWVLILCRCSWLASGLASETSQMVVWTLPAAFLFFVCKPLSTRDDQNFGILFLIGFFFSPFQLLSIEIWYWPLYRSDYRSVRLQLGSSLRFSFSQLQRPPLSRTEPGMCILPCAACYSISNGNSTRKGKTDIYKDDCAWNLPSTAL